MRQKLKTADRIPRYRYHIGFNRNCAAVVHENADMALKMPVAKHGFVTPCGRTTKDVSAFDLLVCRIVVRLFSSSPELLLICVMHTYIHTYSGGKIPGVRATKFVRWCLIYIYIYIYIYMHTYIHIYIHTYPGRKIPGVRANKFVRWRLIFVGPQYRPCSISPVWCVEFWRGSYIFEMFVYPCITTWYITHTCSWY